MDVLALERLAELATRKGVGLALEIAPQIQVGEEIGVLVGEPGVGGVGPGSLLERPLARVLDRQRGRDHDHLLGAAQAIGLEHHPAHPRVDRQPGQPAPQRSQAPVRGQRAELDQQVHTVADLAAVGRLEERERFDVPEPERGHLKDHRAKVRAADLRVGKAWALGELLLGVEPNADAVRGPAAAALPLIRARLRHRLDRQALDLQPRAVARDARGPDIDDRADARDGQRRFGNVGRQHDAVAVSRPEHALLLAAAQAGEQRQDLGLGAQAPAQRVGGVANLALAREEHEHVAAAGRLQLLHRVTDRVDLVGVLAQRSIADLDRIGPSAHLDDRRAAKVLGEALDVDRRAGDDDLQVRPFWEDRLQITEQKVDVQAPLVRLVDNHRVVTAQHPVAGDLGEQEPVGHDPEQRVRARAIVEPHRVPDGPPQRDTQLVRDSLGDRPRRQPPRLRMRDRPTYAAPQLEAHLGQLRRLPGARFARDDHHLVVADRREQLVAASADRQLIGIPDRGRDRRLAPLPTLPRALVRGRIELPALQAMLVEQRQLVVPGRFDHTTELMRARANTSSASDPQRSETGEATPSPRPRCCVGDGRHAATARGGMISA